ncbi:sugar ABC transporter substrate-binding protein [Pengzhenrongella frigida]|uniref:Extracellular solute-binding protein n=1 Tax=Pengzhenrongella frigida TaxID=1259133 RepID=A0A4Q5N5S5_9MICO|nr:extracellular solute-binding protein [Cellulomonas sp. HLT2-17]RYV52933.1 extracellular solute-binding protein [Cellulomonas sp. HLT2-17]
MKRPLVVLTATLAAAGMLAACSGGTTTPKGADGTAASGPIKIWYSNNPNEVAWGEQVVEAWNADHADEQVTGQEIPAGRSSEEVIGAAITAGNTPCLIYNTAPVAVPGFQKQGGLVDLSTFPDGAEYIEARTGEAASQYVSADGDYYQMPWKSNPVMFFYNKAIMTAAGVDPENPPLATYDEFLDTSRKIVASGAATYAIYPSPASEFYQSWFDFYPLYAAESGGTLLVEDGASTFAGEEGTAVADFWRTIYDEKLAGNEPYTGDAFNDGVAAIASAGPWAVESYGDIDWGVAPIPTSTGTAPEETYTFADSKNVGMYSSCENTGTAWEFLKFSTSEEQDGTLLETTGQMPLRANLTDAFPDYFATNPDYTTFADQANRTVDVPNVENSVEVWQTFRDAWTSAVIFGEDEIPSALKDAAGTIDELAVKK